MKKLITLEEHNLSIIGRIKKEEPIVEGNGLACPNCRQELIDSKEPVIMTTIPAKKAVFCRNCSYKGYKYIG